MSKTKLWMAAGLCAGVLTVVGFLNGCGTLDRAYEREVTWTNAPVVHVFTNNVVLTNLVPVVVERTNFVFVTNATSGAVFGVASREAIATNYVTATVTNAAGAPVAGVTVRFSVTGSVNTSGSDTTDANGEATFCYTGPAFPGRTRSTPTLTPTTTRCRMRVSRSTMPRRPGSCRSARLAAR